LTQHIDNNFDSERGCHGEDSKNRYKP